MPLLPKIQDFLTKLSLIKDQLTTQGFKPNQTNTREALANITRTYLTEIDYSILAIDDVVLNGRFPIPLRIYLPAEHKQPLPVAVFIHGGGHMCGNISVYDGVARNLARHAQQIIVAIDYRLAPEFPYPTGLNDCKCAIRGLFSVLEHRKIAYTSRELSIIGDSAGGAICASISMDKEFVAVEQIKRQVLIYPSLDYTGSSPSVAKFATGYFLEAAKMEWYFANYFQNGEDPRKVSPLFGEFYAKMPATLVITAAFDPLQGEAAQYYNNVMQVGAAAELIHVEGVVHAYLMLENLCPDECASTYQEINKFLQSTSQT